MILDMFSVLMQRHSQSGSLIPAVLRGKTETVLYYRSSQEKDSQVGSVIISCLSCLQLTYKVQSQNYRGKWPEGARATLTKIRETEHTFIIGSVSQLVIYLFFTTNVT